MPTPPAPAAPPSATARLGAQLEAMGVLPDARHLAAARALVAQTGELDMRSLTALARVLGQLGKSGQADAASAAMLLDRGVEPTRALLDQLQGHATEPSGERLAELARRGGPAAELLQPLTLPGDRERLPAALRALVAAFTPPEADLARGQVAQAATRLVSKVAAELKAHPGDPGLERLSTEIRLAQLPTQSDPALTIPWWGPQGQGEVRIQPEAEGTRKPPGEGSLGTHLVVAMETPELHGLRFDCHLTPGQVNCHVVAEDPAVATFLASHLEGLRLALEGAGFAVPNLEVTARGRQARGVDLYG